MGLRWTDVRGRRDIVPGQDQMKLLTLGIVALDGTKLHGHASRHRALSYGHAERIEAQLQAEVQELIIRRIFNVIENGRK